MKTPKNAMDNFSLSWEWVFILAVFAFLVSVLVSISFVQIYPFQANSISTATIPPSTYQGIVQAIYTNSPSSITFTSGQTWQGNISKVSNLSIGAVCTLIQYRLGQSFIDGTCKVIK